MTISQTEKCLFQLVIFLDEITYARRLDHDHVAPAKRENTNDYLHWAYVLEYTIALTTIDQ